MNIIASFDALCIEKTEKICQSIQRLTGITNHRLYGFITLLSTLSLLDLQTGVIFQAEMIKKSIYMLMFTDAPFMYWAIIITGLIDSMFSFHREKNAFEMVRSGCSNPSKINPLHMFIRINLILIFVAVSTFYYFGIIGAMYDLFILATYVAGILIFACDPLPPNDGKIKEWVKSLKSIVSRRLTPQLTKP